jgi:hypothetical protein
VADFVEVIQAAATVAGEDVSRVLLTVRIKRVTVTKAPSLSSSA